MAEHPYAIYPGRKLIVLRYIGRTSVGDMQEAAQEIWNDPQYDPNYSGIVDFREAMLGASPAEVKQVSEYFLNTSQASLGRAAIVADHPMETAINLIFSKLMAPRNNLQIFSTWEAACIFVTAPDLPDPIHAGS